MTEMEFNCYNPLLCELARSGFLLEVGWETRGAECYHIGSWQIYDLVGLLLLGRVILSKYVIFMGFICFLCYEIEKQLD